MKGREHWDQYFSFVRVGFRPIAEFRLRHWLPVLRIFVFLRGPGAAQLDLLEKLMMYLTSCVELMATWRSSKTPR